MDGQRNESDDLDKKNELLNNSVLRRHSFIEGKII